MSHRIRYVAVLLMGVGLFAAGCRTDVPAAPAATTGGATPPVAGAAASPAAVIPEKPPARKFDAAAEKELKEAFGDFDESRAAARKKYSSDRWHIAGRAGDISGTTILFRPEGSEQLIIGIKSQAEVEKLIKSQDYVIEATIEDMPTRQFRDGVVLDDPGKTAAGDGDARQAWRYAGVRVVYPGQRPEGVFRRQSADKWIEEFGGGGQQEWREIRRTPEHVELSLPGGSVHVRLGAGSATYRFGTERDWQPLFAGNWETAEAGK